MGCHGIFKCAFDKCDLQAGETAEPTFHLCLEFPNWNPESEHML